MCARIMHGSAIRQAQPEITSATRLPPWVSKISSGAGVAPNLSTSRSRRHLPSSSLAPFSAPSFSIMLSPSGPGMPSPCLYPPGLLVHDTADLPWRRISAAPYAEGTAAADGVSPSMVMESPDAHVRRMRMPSWREHAAYVCQPAIVFLAHKCLISGEENRLLGKFSRLSSPSLPIVDNATLGW